MDWIMEQLNHPTLNVMGRDFSDLDYADDVTLLASDTASLKQSLVNLDSVAKYTGLKINWNKTKIQNLSAGDNADALAVNDSITVDNVTEFIYLGSKISSDGRCSPDILLRIAHAASAMDSCKMVWSQSKLSLKTKLRIYQTCILPILLYGSETWTLLSKDSKGLEAFHVRCMRRILQIRWYDRISNATVYDRTALPNIDSVIKKRRLSTFGHAVRLSDQTPVNRAVSCAIDLKSSRRPPTVWKRALGRPRQTWIQQIGLGTPSSILEQRDAALGQVHIGATPRAQPP
jgi:hypothetical protein